MLVNTIILFASSFLLIPSPSHALIPYLQRPYLKAQLRKACDRKEEAEIFRLAGELQTVNPTTDIIKDFDRLDGDWKLDFTTAPAGEVPDEGATGVKTYQTIDAAGGLIYNVIDRGLPEQGLRIEIGAEPTRKDRVALDFRTIEALSETFPKRFVFRFPPRKLVRAAFVAGNVLFGGGEPWDERKFKEIGHFDVLFLDEDLRIQRNSEGNLFINSRI
eukprot:CAMPEP_0194334312 /NCGR_PEP_ID=MMETSP0171-20130528/65682_1 /TAXON_ID=218684 /ORGANISM="Corethron pennatum, Strain L29A3" /LENGTH=216 /DNA_ID=CAMNT_0039096901 /DNA_START=76 /DNA_END=726 /DNA_ORIENTATION=+